MNGRCRLDLSITSEAAWGAPAPAQNPLFAPPLPPPPPPRCAPAPAALLRRCERRIRSRIRADAAALRGGEGGAGRNRAGRRVGPRCGPASAWGRAALGPSGFSRHSSGPAAVGTRPTRLRSPAARTGPGFRSGSLPPRPSPPLEYDGRHSADSSGGGAAGLGVDSYSRLRPVARPCSSRSAPPRRPRSPLTSCVIDQLRN
jgi:hypothetical protein